MTAIVMRTCLTFFVFTCFAAAASCDTNESVENIVPYGHISNTVERCRQESTWLRKHDKSGKYDTQSERAKELQKFALTFTSSDKVVSTGTTASLFIRLSRPDEGASAIHQNPQSDLEIRRKLLDMRVIPVWTETGWVDGLPLVINGFEISDSVKEDLLKLNFAEQSFGERTVPERAKESQKYFSERPDVNHIGKRLVIMKQGHEVKYDRTFGIWRITDTNAPAARSP